VRVAAETPKFAKALQRESGFPIFVAPYPMHGIEPLPYDTGDGPLTVLCGGSARADKGFFRLEHIVTQANRTIGVQNIRFLIQNLVVKEQLLYRDYVKKLYCIPNVTLLDGVLSYEEMAESYRQAHLSMMPYSQETYEFRGSAILMESLLQGRIVIGQARTAFAEQIKYYCGGDVCDSDLDFVEALRLLAESPRHYLKEQADMARRRYLADVDQAYDNWLGSAK